MGDYKAIVKAGDCKNAYISRNATVQEINTAIISLKEHISKEEITRSMFRRFEILNRDSDKLLEELNANNKLFIVEAMQHSATIQDDLDSLADQDGIQKVRDDLIEYVVQFQDKLEGSEFDVPGPEPDDSIHASDPALVKILEESQQQAKDMAAVLEKQTAALERITADQTAAINDGTKAGIKSSEDLAKALETLGKSSSNIKPTQPHFAPKNTLEDYLKYKHF